MTIADWILVVALLVPLGLLALASVWLVVAGGSPENLNRYLMVMRVTMFLMFAGLSLWVTLMMWLLATR